MNKKQQASLETSKKILAIARKHFALKGYAETSLEEIVDELGMTRGALYHHFRNKKTLFTAVLAQIQSELGSYVEKNALEAHDSWEQLVEGCVAFVRFATLTENKRILLLDGPNVVEWKEWRRQDEVNSFFHLREQLDILAKEGKLISIDLDMAAHMISGALNELSLFLAEKEGGAEVREAVRSLLRGFKNHGEKG